MPYKRALGKALEEQGGDDQNWFLYWQASSNTSYASTDKLGFPGFVKLIAILCHEVQSLRGSPLSVVNPSI